MSMIPVFFLRISTLLLQYVLPLAIISFAYIRIWSKLRNHVSPVGRNDRHHRRRKTTKMLVTMVCTVPSYYIIVFLQIFSLDVRISSTSTSTTLCTDNMVMFVGQKKAGFVT